MIHYIRTKLPPELSRQFRFHIKCGSSVGAINAAFMAAMAHDPIRQGSEILRLWEGIRSENIYRRGAVPLGKLILRSLFGIAFHLFGIKGVRKEDDLSLHFRGLFDTTPMVQTLRQHCPWPQIGKNIQSGIIDAVAISATNMASGDVELFTQRNPNMAHSDRIKTHLVRLSPRHVMASAALPILFPSVPIHEVYYNDGGIRLNTPLAPAVSLGAARIVVIGTRPEKQEEVLDTQARIRKLQTPSIGTVLGRIFNTFLLDRLEADRDQVGRINRILAACAKHVSTETYQTICREAGVHRIETLSIFPSVDFGTFVDETVRGSYRKLISLGLLERAILRLLEAQPEYGNDLLSYFLFEPTYLKKLIELGYEDARSHHDKLLEFAERSVEGIPVA